MRLKRHVNGPKKAARLERCRSWAKTQKQKRCYSGKKKHHTLKAQVIADSSSRKILCVHTSDGSTHDFKLFKQTIHKIHAETVCFANSGYQGLKKRHTRGYVPKKGSKHYPLSETDRPNNRMLAGYRIAIKNNLCCLKVFGVLSEKYRNRRKRYGLRFNLIAALYNRDLDLKSDL